MNKHFETLAIAIVCSFFVLSMHQTCSGLSNKKIETKEKIDMKKVQNLKNNTINTNFIKQR